VEKQKGGKKMKKIWLAIAGIALIALVIGLAGCGSNATNGTLELKGNLNNQQEGIWVSGEGKITVTPDVAILSVGIQAQEITVADAQTEAAAAMDAVIKALKDQGVKDNDIQTQYFNIQKITRWDNDKQQEVTTGFQVNNTVTAKVRDVTKAGATIDAVVAAGGDLTRVNSVSFTVDDPSGYYEDARIEAVKDAAAKAKTLADAAGVKLGKATYISETSYTPSPIRVDYAVKGEGSTPAVDVTTPVSPGEIDITANVQIAYDITG
jgi:uncharacterized protein YggE